MMLLLDIGNTRLKWALCDQDRLAAVHAVIHDGRPQDAIANLEVDDPDAIWVASVMDAASQHRVQQALQWRWPVPPRLVTPEVQCDGLVNGYAEPRRLGVDRWLAMLGAWTQVRGPCVVADAGTALTVDVVGADGRHRGGIIAAGLSTSRSALLGATRFATRRVPPPVQVELGTDTEACVDQGALMSCLGAIDRASASAPQAPGFVAGGDAARLLPHLPAHWRHQPDLVLQGLLHRARLGD